MDLHGSFHVYDTTLRDGAQQEGLNLSVADKLSIARQLDGLGVGGRRNGQRNQGKERAPHRVETFLPVVGWFAWNGGTCTAGNAS